MDLNYLRNEMANRPKKRTINNREKEEFWNILFKEFNFLESSYEIISGEISNRLIFKGIKGLVKVNIFYEKSEMKILINKKFYSLDELMDTLFLNMTIKKQNEYLDNYIFYSILGANSFWLHLKYLINIKDCNFIIEQVEIIDIKKTMDGYYTAELQLEMGNTLKKYIVKIQESSMWYRKMSIYVKDEMIERNDKNNSLTFSETILKDLEEKYKSTPCIFKDAYNELTLKDAIYMLAMRRYKETREYKLTNIYQKI